MKILTECALCRMGILSRVPLCFSYGNPLACMCWRVLPFISNHKEQTP